EAGDRLARIRAAEDQPRQARQRAPKGARERDPRSDQRVPTQTAKEVTGGGPMKAFVFVLVAAATLAAPPAFAQTKTVTGETKTGTASVEAIDVSAREVTVKKPDGTYDVFYVPPGMKRFDTLKVGDKVTARYYENMVLTVQRPGEKPKDSGNAAVTRSQSGTA